MKEYSRRDFLAASAVAGGSLAMGAFASPCSAAPVPAGNMMYGVLLHLGGHMWGDWTFDASMIPGSPEELAKMFPDDKLSANGVLPTRVTNYLRSEEGVWRSVIRHCDLVLFDIKETDEERHRRYTGVSLQPILANLRLLNEERIPFVIRAPIIPTLNAREAHLRALSALRDAMEYCRELQLMPYHGIGAYKYGQLGRDYPCRDIKEPTAEQVAAWRRLL
jgi:hypothetical protein